MVDRPSTPLKTHARPVPYLGGVMVAAGTAVGLLIYPGIIPPELCGLIWGAGLLLAVGLADDVKPISPYPKFLFQIAATILAIRGGIHVSIQALPFSVNMALTFLWMIGITNAFNIIDVHDGLCAGVAALVGLGLMLVSVFTTLFDKTFVTVASAALTGSLIAFLRVNVPPAKMFLGDAGSLPVGFLLAGLAIGESYTPDHLVGLLVPFVLFLVPIYDLIFVVVIRVASGKSPIRGSPDHVAVRLRCLGWDDRRVLISLLSLSAFGAILSPGIVFFPLPYATFLAVLLTSAGVGIGIWLARITPK